MSITHTRTPSPEITTPDTELAKIAEQTLESKKPEIIGKTREKVGRFAGVFGLAAAFATTPALAEKPLYTYEPTADVGGAMLVIKEGSLVKSLEQRGFSSAFAQEVDRLERENREQRAHGEIPNEPDYTVSIEPVAPIKDAKGMEMLDTEGRPLTRADEKSLGLPSELDESTLTDTLNRLFEGDESGKSRYAKRIMKLQSTPNGADALLTFFRLYNEGKKTLTYPSRESYRHLFTASYAIASFFAEAPDKRQGLVPGVVSSVGEFMLLTDQKTDTIVHVRVGIPDYLVAPSSSIQNNPVLGKLPSVVELQSVSDTILIKLRKDEERMVKNGKLQVGTVQNEAKVAQNEAKVAQNEAKTAQNEAKVAQKEEENTRVESINSLMKSIDSLSMTTAELMSQYREKSTNELKKRIMENVQKIDELQKKIQAINTDWLEWTREWIEKINKQVRLIHVLYTRTMNGR